MTSQNRMAIAMAMATALLCAAAGATAAPQPIDDFARRPQMQGVTISGDGRYVAFLSGSGDDTILMTYDRQQPGPFKRVTGSEPGKFDIGWCRFANYQRLLCGLYGNILGKKYAEPPFTRMFAVNADGAELKALEQIRKTDANLFVATTSFRNLNMNQGAEIERGEKSVYSRQTDGGIFSNTTRGFGGGYRADRQDQVIDFTPDEPDSVLIQLDDDNNTYDSIFRLNIDTGLRAVHMHDHPPIRNYVTDGSGHPRIGWGIDGVTTNYFARLDGDKEWRPLAATRAFTASNSLRPIAMAVGANTAYALGNHEGRDALWSIDLTDAREPQLLFTHKLVDTGEPLFRHDRRLLGVRYDVERPYVWYADPKLRDLIDRLERLQPGRVHEIVDSSADMKTLVVRSTSDTDAGTYSLYDVEKDKLQKLGSGYPELDAKTLGAMSNILYKAKDGTEVPGYLTVPSGAEKKNLPLVVLPHDGPMQRDSWEFNFLRNFLANRGYAVLQMNYRGSSGFGQKWWLDAHQDFAGISYSDIHDATRWAVQEGIADPKRICIMGWGFGGYAALLGAMRNGDTYKCAVSIGGVADIALYQEHGVVSGETDLRKQQLGSDATKLAQNSPLQNAAQINVPVLLVHGAKDWQVQADHSKAMARALDKNKKEHTLVVIKGATHDLERKSDRVTLLTEVEGFLAKNLGGGTAH